MSGRAPLVRQINMLPIEPHGETTAVFRALDKIDADAEHARDERDGLLCRCDELEAIIEQVKQLHAKTPTSLERPWNWCGACHTYWPCPTMKLIGE